MGKTQKRMAHTLLSPGRRGAQLLLTSGKCPVRSGGRHLQIECTDQNCNCPPHPMAASARLLPQADKMNARNSWERTTLSCNSEICLHLMPFYIQVASASIRSSKRTRPCVTLVRRSHSRGMDRGSAAIMPRSRVGLDTMKQRAVIAESAPHLSIRTRAWPQSSRAYLNT